MTNNKQGPKIVLATRVEVDKKEENNEKSKKYQEYINLFSNLINNKYISKIYIISNLNAKDTDIDKDGKQFIFIKDDNPVRATAFNLVLERLRNDAENCDDRYHLLTYSKEVRLKDVYIEKMVKEIEKQNKKDKLIVVGFEFQDNVTEEAEYNQYANDNNGDIGIAYRVPWSTCALWNKEFVYGKDKNKLEFDKICENKPLDHLKVKIHNILMETEYEGMEDGLAIAKLITNNKNKKIEYKLFDEYLFWRLPRNDERILRHKIKLARKNIVLSTFMNIKGYSIDKLIESGRD